MVIKNLLLFDLTAPSYYRGIFYVLIDSVIKLPVMCLHFGVGTVK